MSMFQSGFLGRSLIFQIIYHSTFYSDWKAVSRNVEDHEALHYDAPPALGLRHTLPHSSWSPEVPLRPYQEEYVVSYRVKY